MRKGKNREIYIRFLLNALPILIIPLFLLFSAYFRNQKLFKQEIYDKNISILENSALMGESMMASVESIVNYLDESSSVNKFLNFYSLNEDGTNTNEVILLQKDINSLITANDAIDNIQIFSKNNKMLLDGTQVVINLNRYYDYTFSITGIDYDHWYHEMLMGIHNWNNRLQTLETTDKSITKQMFFSAATFLPIQVFTAAAACLFFWDRTNCSGILTDWNIKRMGLFICRTETAIFFARITVPALKIFTCRQRRPQKTVDSSPKNWRK